MFDRIDQPPQVPLYPAKRTLQLRPQWTSYNAQHSQDAVPINTGPQKLSPPQIPSPIVFEANQGDRYRSRAVYDGSEGNIPIDPPSQSYTRVSIPGSGGVEVRRPIRPYAHNGGDWWRADGVASTGRNDAVGFRACLLYTSPSPRD